MRITNMDESATLTEEPVVLLHLADGSRWRIVEDDDGRINICFYDSWMGRMNVQPQVANVVSVGYTPDLMTENDQ